VPTDAELIAAVRGGSMDAYADLYRRHVEPARALARQLTGDPAERDDLVAEAFAKLLSMLLRGGGPDSAFRAYLLTVLRHLRADRARHDRRVELTDDLGPYDRGVPWRDTAVDRLDERLAGRAFTRLPERWRAVLWHTEVEREPPAVVARRLGLTPNGVSALAYRAREGLRQAYLQEHLGPGPGHAATGRLGAYARGGLSPRLRAETAEHLASCASCGALAAELAEVADGLLVGVAPRAAG
jgi:RNA polymerase sigma factor (sigma-70 family)